MPPFEDYIFRVLREMVQRGALTARLRSAGRDSGGSAPHQLTSL